jgi:DNA-binding response OmpR family regulator
MLDKEVGMNKKILVIDDDPNARFLAKKMLENDNFETFLACDGKEGYEEARKLKPDVILLDIMMPPGESGIEVSRKLEATPETSGIPVIFLSSLLYDTDMKISDKLHGRYYLPKPLHVEDFRNILQNRLGFAA